MPTTPTIPAGNLFMNATLYTGNNSTQTITNGVAGQAFQPDFLWLKKRSGSTASHTLFNSVTTLGSNLKTDSTGIETLPSPNDGLTAINSNGFSLGANNNSGCPDINYTLNSTYVAWQWKGGGTAVTNTAGATQSQVSANTTSGFSVVTYTSPNTLVDTTIGHGLGVIPQFIITKNRDAVWNWDIWHKDLSSGYGLIFDALNQQSGRWSTTTPTNNVFTAKYNYEHVSTNKFVAYCWTPIAGYSAFGSYTGNGDPDGPFIYTGFRPRFVLLKGLAATSWWIYDSSRNTYNAVDLGLVPNLPNIDTSGYPLDFLSNGFKFRNLNGDFNGSGVTYIYACFAENPFKYANAR